MGRKKSKFTGIINLRRLPPETVMAFRQYCKDNNLTQSEAFTDLVVFAQASNLMKGFDDYYYDGEPENIQ